MKVISPRVRESVLLSAMIEAVRERPGLTASAPYLSLAFSLRCKAPLARHSSHNLNPDTRTYSSAKRVYFLHSNSLCIPYQMSHPTETKY